MKRKIVIFLIVALLVCSLAFNVLAANSNEILSKVTADKPYATFLMNFYGSSSPTGYYDLLILTSEPMVCFPRSSTEIAVYVPPGNDYDVYRFEDGTWGEMVHFDVVNDYKEFTVKSLDYIWSNYDIKKYNTDEVVHPSDYAVCDGTSCPATDANLDNICDDCGKVLTMSLRNPLLDYARSLAQGKADEYPYYAIFNWNDTYLVHISKSPMSSPDGVVLTGDGIMYNRVSQSGDGVNGSSGWYNGFYDTYDTFVEANHSISNFKEALPMAEAILGVTEEQMEETLPELGRTMMIILLCGVGCLALLILSSLLAKVFGRFRQG